MYISYSSDDLPIAGFSCRGSYSSGDLAKAAQVATVEVTYLKLPR